MESINKKKLITHYLILTTKTNMKKSSILLVITALLFFSCNFKQEKRKADLSGIDFEVKIERFDKDFWALKESKNQKADLEKLFEKYPEFAPLYFTYIIKFGESIDEILEEFPYFFSREDVNNLYPDALKKFDNVSKMEKSLTNAFRRMKYFFPTTLVPKCIMQVSGGNFNVMVRENFVAVSTEYYLGANYPLYDYFPDIFPMYMRQYMTPENVASTYVSEWLMSKFPYFSEQDKLLDEMIYQGKILYITSLLMNDEKIETLIGYTPEQWKWCKKYEKDMWQRLIEEKYLFSIDFNLRKKILEDAPFTQPFTQESPGRAGIFVGYRIVESYMNKNENISPLELMQNADAQGILEKSGYRPK